jgi:hypothetical protein
VVAGAIALATAAPAHADGNASNLDQIVAQVYEKRQAQCTPSMPPHFVRIDWDTFPISFGPHTDVGHYPTGSGGRGRIVDANPSLGGPFQAWWGDGSPGLPDAIRVPAQPNGYWDITLAFC